MGIEIPIDSQNTGEGTGHGKGNSLAATWRDKGGLGSLPGGRGAMGCRYRPVPPLCPATGPYLEPGSRQWCRAALEWAREDCQIRAVGTWEEGAPTPFP